MGTTREPEREASAGAQASLHATEELFRLLVDSVKDYAIFVLDAGGHVATWNVGAERIKGYRADEIIGKHFSIFVPPEDAAKPAWELEVAAREGRFEDEGWRLRKDGTRFWANVVITALRDPAGALVGFAKVTRDLTERRRAEDERLRLAQESAARAAAEREARLLERLHSLAGSLAAARTPEEVARAIVDEGTNALSAESGSFAVPRDDGSIELIATRGTSPEVVAQWRTFVPDARTPMGATFLTGKPEWIGDEEELARRFPQMKGSAVVTLPLAASGRTIALLGFRFAERRAFPENERLLLQAMASQAAQALERANAYAYEVSARRRVELLRDFAESLSAALTVDDVARVVVDRGMKAARADTCTLYVLDEPSGMLVLIGEQGCNPAVVDHIRCIGPESDNPVYDQLASGEPEWAETADEYAKFFPRLATSKIEGGRAQGFWSVPLMSERRCVGLLGMGFHRARRFPPEERAFVATFTRQCGEALLRAKRLEAERQARAIAERLQSSLATTLRSIGDAVIATDVNGAITMMNPVAEALTGWREAEGRGHGLVEVFRILNEHTRAPVENPVDKVLAHGVVVGLANHTVLIAKDGREIPIDDSGAPIRRESGGPIEGVVLVFRDVSASKREEARRAFLDEATATLAESLDYEATLAKVARLAVPRLADWAAVDVVQDREPRPKRLAVAHVDPDKVRFAQELEEKYPADLDAPTGVPNVLRTGRSELYAEITDAMLVAGSKDEEHLRLARSLGLKSAIVAPLAARERVLGAITFVSAESGRRYDDDDRRFAEELARRCAIAIDNARLYASELRARQNADVANRAKDEFLAMVSHELRTPLNAIMGWAKMMAAPSFSEQRRGRAVETIERNAVAMAQLIDDLLDMSRIISGKMRLEMERVDLPRVIEAALESIKPAAEAKEIRLAQAIDPAVRTIAGDPTRLQQIVWNLLSNAVKFTPRGGRVDVVLRTSGAWAEIDVADTGKGIAPSFLPFVWSPFRQEDASYTRTHGGLGLGLAITRQLVEAHGGKIQAKSEGEGKGSTFTVCLPIEGTTRPSDAARAEPRDRGVAFSHPPELHGLRVLVVEDDADGRDLVRTMLEECEARVTCTASADEALAAMAREVPDVLVSDIGMPDRNGYELIRAVRALPKDEGGEVPAIALTAYTRAEDRREALAAGYQAHVTKPLEPMELVAVLVSVARRR